MNKLRRILLTSLALAMVSLPPLAAGEAPATKERVVIQVSDKDPQKWNLALNVAGNVQKELGAGNVEVALVAFGPGIEMLTADSEVAGRLGEAITKGVAVEACANSMRANKINQEDLAKNVVVVPAGAVEIIKRQSAGWSYLRP
ncbi:MAG: DsrE family protein [Chromatiaceae bacterium]